MCHHRMILWPVSLYSLTLCFRRFFKLTSLGAVLRKRMSKIIKKIIRSLTVVIALLILIPAIAVLLIRMPKFQTFAARKFVEYFSGKTGTYITVGKVSYTFFNKLVLNDLLVKDQNQDTLLSVRQSTLRIKEFRPALQQF